MDYNKETNRLELPHGLVVGKDINRDIGDQEEGKEEYANTAMDTKDGGSVLAGMIFNPIQPPLPPPPRGGGGTGEWGDSARGDFETEYRGCATYLSIISRVPVGYGTG